MISTDLTVAALIEDQGKFLLVEETVAGSRVLTQPGGHIEDGESAEDAAKRETVEEAGVEVVIRELINTYRWRDDKGRQALRIVFLADLDRPQTPAPQDPMIHAAHWLTYAEIAARQEALRSPSVLRCVDDYLAGARQPRSLFADCARQREQIDRVLASAERLTI